jgi:hypothetical protein
MRSLWTVLLAYAILSPEIGAAQSGTAVGAAVADSAPVAAPAAKKKKGLFGKVKGLANNKIVETVAKTTIRFGGALVAATLLTACTDPAAPPLQSTESPGAATTAVLNPNRNLEIILRGEGFGLVKFRQPKDDVSTIILDTWVRDLTPGARYLLQRATDFDDIDDICTGENWLTLGKGLTPQALVPDAKGTARETLSRVLPPSFIGGVFDIKFRVIEEAAPQRVVLESACYQFVVTL